MMSRELNRREVMGLMAAVPLAAALGSTSRAHAQESDEDDGTVDYLFVQTAERVTLEDGVLTLHDINSSTLYFSDRPERIVGHARTDQFTDHWGTGENSFAADPPNAALSILVGDEPQDVVVVLKNPRLESDNLIYDVEVLEGNSEAKGGACALFIDTIGRPATPMSVAGVRRRQVRRRVR